MFYTRTIKAVYSTGLRVLRTQNGSQDALHYEKGSQLSIVLAVPFQAFEIISLHGDKDGRYWPGEIVIPCGDDYHYRQTWQHDCTHR